MEVCGGRQCLAVGIQRRTPDVHEREVGRGREDLHELEAGCRSPRALLLQADVDLVQLLIALQRRPERAAPEQVTREVPVGHVGVVLVPARLQLRHEPSRRRVRVTGNRGACTERRARGV